MKKLEEYWQARLKKQQVPVPFNFFLYIFLASGGGPPLCPEFIQYYTMILQRPRSIVGDAGFEPETSVPQKSGALPV